MFEDGKVKLQLNFRDWEKVTSSTNTSAYQRISTKLISPQFHLSAVTSRHYSEYDSRESNQLIFSNEQFHNEISLATSHANILMENINMLPSNEDLSNNLVIQELLLNCSRIQDRLLAMLQIAKEEDHIASLTKHISDLNDAKRFYEDAVFIREVESAKIASNKDNGSEKTVLAEYFINDTSATNEGNFQSETERLAEKRNGKKRAENY